MNIMKKVKRDKEDSFREPEWIPEGLTKEQLMKARVRFLLQRLKEYRILN